MCVLTPDKRALQIKCPQCGKAVDWSPKSPFRPFCSERCKLIDLGKWACEEHVIAEEPINPEDLDDPNNF